MRDEVKFTRGGSAAALIESLLSATSSSIDAALYRFNLPCLAAALEGALRRGVRLRLLLDRNKYEEARSTRDLLAARRLPFRLLCGRQGRLSKMHHKFAILDAQTVLTGSYNWTLESEEQNYESLVILREGRLVEDYRQEFEKLWEEATEVSAS